MTPEITVLDRLLEVSELFQKDMARAFDGTPLTTARVRVLWDLVAAGPSTQHALAERLEVSPRNITGLVDALEAGGYVTRSPHPTDRRAIIVSLAASAHEMMQQMQRRPRRALGRPARRGRRRRPRCARARHRRDRRAAARAHRRRRPRRDSGERVSDHDPPRGIRLASRRPLRETCADARTHIYASIGRFVARRPAIPRGAAGFSFHKPVLTILIIFIVLSAVEIPIIDLIVHPWPAVRIPLLVLGIWGVTWMFGLLCAYLMRPHTVGPDGINVRGGLEIDVALSWDDIASVARNRRIDEPKSPKIVETDGSRTLLLRINDETNIEIELERPTVVRLPGHGVDGGEQTVTAVRIWVDDPQAFMDEVRKYL